MTEFEKKSLLHQLDVIQSSVKLTEEFRQKYGTDFKMIEACIKEDFIKEDAIEHIKRVAPLHFKIGDTVFLLGDETPKRHDFIGDNLDDMPAYELFNMTKEITSGLSTSFYVSNYEYFSFASVEETIESINFLKSLK